MKKKMFFSILLAATIFSSCDKNDDDNYNNPPVPEIKSTVLKASGSKDDVQAKLDEFRALSADSRKCNSR